MGIDATTTTDINTTFGGQQHSETKKADLMRSNSCFYCEKQGHRAKDCCKKQADRGNSSNHPKEPARACITTPMMPNIQDPDTMVNFLNENMDSFSVDTRLGIIEKLMPKEDFMEALNWLP